MAVAELVAPPTMIAAGTRHKRAAHLQWIRLVDLSPAPRAQRAFIPAWANYLKAQFNLEAMGFPVVNKRDGRTLVIDGQHRIHVLKELGFSDDDQIQCEVYEGLTEEEEARVFLERNKQKTVAALDRFRVAVIAGLTEETAIDEIVRHQGLHIGNPGISAVVTLRKVYQRCGELGLGKVLRVIRDAYGDAGFDAVVIEGIGLMVHRYADDLNEARLIAALSSASGGLNGLLTQAWKTRAVLGQQKGQCVAATAVSFYNRSAGKKLAPWWREQAA